ncbi:MAG: UpxY family transcription antiterminator, partial [Desulfosarcina sp.]
RFGFITSTGINGITPMVGDQLTRAWFALHTKSRFENVVNEGLTKKTVEVFLPKITVKSRRRDRHKMIRVPLFPGYLFVRTDLNPYRHVEILKTTGAVRLIGNIRGPLPIADATIDSLKIMVCADGDVITGTRFKKGDRVMVINGPFAGVTGVFSSYRGEGRVIVNIEALGQFAAVNVDAADVEKLPEKLS